MRQRPKLQLTAEGHALVDLSRRVLESASDIEAHFHMRKSLRGSLRLGVPATFAHACMTDFLLHLELRYPAVKALVRVNDSNAKMLEMLDSKELDIAIVVGPVSKPDLHQQPVGQTVLTWFARPDVNLPEILQPSDLAPFHIILTPPPSRLMTTVMDWFTAAGVSPARISTCNDIHVNIDTVAKGIAIGALPRALISEALSRGQVRELKTSPELPPHKIVICSQSAAFGPGLDEVVQLIRNLIDQQRLYG